VISKKTLSKIPLKETHSELMESFKTLIPPFKRNTQNGWNLLCTAIKHGAKVSTGLLIVFIPRSSCNPEKNTIG